MKIVYVIGPFRAATPWGIAENVRAAERLALAVARLGAWPICPHANTQYCHGELPDQQCLDGTLELLRRSDAAIAVRGWEPSEGSRGEVLECRRLGIPCFEDLEELREWLHAQSVPAPGVSPPNEKQISCSVAAEPGAGSISDGGVA